VLALLALVFVVIPLVEIYVAVQVGHAVGALDTIGLLIVISIVGAWIARREGFAVIQRVRQRVDQREVPGRELVDGLLILVGGLLLMVPGFVTDGIGLLLLLPPVRAGVRAWLTRRFSVMTLGGPPGPPGPSGPPGAGGPDGYGDGPGIIDV
jgi:UPF0716 protein FxsA